MGLPKTGYSAGAVNAFNLYTNSRFKSILAYGRALAVPALHEIGLGTHENTGF
jgi:hypothetical protein